MNIAMRLRSRACRGILALVPVMVIAPSPVSAASLEVEGISVSVGEDNPRVLYIQPWQTPSLPRRPRAELESDAPRLIQSLDPLALERHRTFRQTLNPLVLNPDRDSAVTEQ